MTFSSSAPPAPPFVEQPLPGSKFVAELTRTERPATARTREASRAEAEAAAHARGFEAGRAEAEASQGAAVATAVEALEAALGGLRERERQRDEAVVHAALSLAIAVARQLLRREIEVDPEALLPCLADAFEALPAGGEIVLALAPADLARLEAGGAEALRGLAVRWNARLSQDARLRPGEARVEAAGAQVELALDPMLARVEQALRERLAPAEVTS